MSVPDSPVPDAYPLDSRRELNRPRDDVRMTVPDDGDNDPPLELEPVDPATASARQGIRSHEQLPTRPIEVSHVAPPRWQFTLAQLIAANTILAVVLATFQVFAPSYTAGALGLAAFSMFLYVTICQPDRQEIYTIYWVLIGLYILVAITALAGS